MRTDPLAHLPRLRRPAAAIGWIAGLHLVSMLPLTVAMVDESWRRPVSGLTLWMGLWLLSAVPLTAIATLIAVRLERAATGITHPMRLAWLGVALGALLGAHWFWLLFWAPAYLLEAATTSHRFEQNLAGAVLALVPWAFFAVGVAVARITNRRMGARSWEGLEPTPSSTWIPTPVLGALAYGMALFPLGVGTAAVAIDERAPLAAIAGWAVLGVVLAGGGAAWALWTADGLNRAPRAAPVAFWELFGLAWVAHWLPAWLLSAMPFHASSRHDEQLVASIGMALLLLAGTAAWSFGRASRQAQSPAAPAPSVG